MKEDGCGRGKSWLVAAFFRVALVSELKRRMG